MKGNRQRRWDKKAILVRQVKALVEATTDVMMENGVGGADKQLEIEAHLYRVLAAYYAMAADLLPQPESDPPRPNSELCK